ncbi:PRP38 family-domain-containing protein [Circinella umbellata]|nr:PRP38 family-domain-containing protein [Circinella umbellata]
MANRTVSDAVQIHGRDPQRLIEKIIRERIYDSMYWKESCFGLSADTLMDKAVQLNYIGGQYGGQTPTEFLCLTLKLLQLQPEKEIIHEIIKQEDFKYLRALGAFYLRIVGRSKEIYLSLEPLLNDPRKLRVREGDGYSLTYMDEFIDQLLREERVCDVILPRLASRYVLEENDELEPRVSGLEGDLESDLDEKEDQEESRGRHSRSRSESRSRSRSPSSSRSPSPRRRRRSPSSSSDRSPSPHRRRRRSPSSDKYRSPSPRRRDRSRDRSHRDDRRRRRYSPSPSPPRRSRSRSISNDRSKSRSHYNQRRRHRSYSRSRSNERRRR